MTDQDLALLEDFESCSLSPASFRHRDHLLVAWSYLRAAPFGEAGERFCRNLRRFAEAHGKSNLFHATITWAYLALVNERIHDAGPSSADGFAAFEFANPDLFHRDQGALIRRYDRAMLFSERARAVFVLPGATTLDAPAQGGSDRGPLG